MLSHCASPAVLFYREQVYLNCRQITTANRDDFGVKILLQRSAKVKSREHPQPFDAAATVDTVCVSRGIDHLVPPSLLFLR